MYITLSQFLKLKPSSDSDRKRTGIPSNFGDQYCFETVLRCAWFSYDTGL